MKVEIIPYHPQWPIWFEKLQAKLKTCLGDQILSIDHIGSTSVPGLASKNRIDVQITISELSQAVKLSLDRGLKSGGFQETLSSTDHCPSGEPGSEDQWQKLFLSGENPDFTFDSNIHIRVKGKANQIYALLFRDYLRSHASAAAAYQQLKEKLAFYLPNNIQAYVDIKDPACDIIMSAAKNWAKEEGLEY